jgi:hypothetical protein
VDYATNSSSSGGSTAVSPLSRDPKWSKRNLPSSLQVDTEADGTAIQTAAKQPVKLSAMHSDMEITVVKNESAFTDYRAYFDKLNSATWNGYGAKAVRIVGISQQYTEELYEGTVIEYYRVTYTFHVIIPRTTVDPTTWDARFLHEGTQSLDPVSSNVVPNRDATNAILSTPQMLDAAGHVTTTAAYLTKVLYQTVSFTTLALVQP